MPTAENVSMANIRDGNHLYNDVLIQIVDPGYKFPIPKVEFRIVHQFEFLDAEVEDVDIINEAKITMEQAAAIVAILTDAYKKDLNVTVHCHMGICRSGAVVEVAEAVGFDITNRFRLPNHMVKRYLLDKAMYNV